MTAARVERPAARLWLVLALLALAGCVRILQPMGPETAAPRLADDAIIAADGYSLPLRAWLPAGPPAAVILALHGFNDYANAFAIPAEAWRAAGIATYAYDQRGFGATGHPGIWAGAETLVADARTAAALLRARHPGTPLYLLGESMGGAIAIEAAAIEAAAGPALPVDGVILVSPAAWSRAIMPGYQRAALWLAVRMVPGMIVSGEGLNIWPTDNYDVLRGLARDPLVLKTNRLDAVDGLVGLMTAAYDDAPRLGPPALVLHGGNEQVLPPAAMAGLLARLPPGSRIARYPQGYHMLLRDVAGGIPTADVAAWIARPDAPLPSGADGPAGAAAAPASDPALDEGA